MFISDDIISLRIAEPQDAEQIYAWENDPRVWRVSETNSPVSHFQIEQFLLSAGDLTTNRQLRLMVHLRTEPLAIGCVDLFDYDAVHQRVGIGILIDESYRRQGYATRAIQLTLDYLFEHVMVHQVHCLIDVTNTESQQLFERLGFQRQGRRKDWIRTPEGFIDALFYQIFNQPTLTP